MMKAHTIIGLIVSIVAGGQLAAQNSSSTAQRQATAAVQAPSTTQNSPAPTVAQQPTTQTNEPGSNLTVYLLTFGWGDVVWERFGHNAIWVSDRARGTDLTYNWGMFDFNQPHFIWRFVTGDTRYWMEPIDYNVMVPYYKSQNRSILAQELNLTPAQRLKLVQFLQTNALPENKFYRYDYYRDNCSTRLQIGRAHV